MELLPRIKFQGKIWSFNKDTAVLRNVEDPYDTIRIKEEYPKVDLTTELVNMRVENIPGISPKVKAARELLFRSYDSLTDAAGELQEYGISTPKLARIADEIEKAINSLDVSMFTQTV